MIKLHLNYLQFLFMIIFIPQVVNSQSCKPMWDRQKSNNVVCSPIQFKANSPGRISFDWDFGMGFVGPGSTVSHRDPTHSFSKSGLNIVRYKFSSPSGDTCIDTMLIYIKENPKVVFHELYSKSQQFSGNKFCFVIDSLLVLDGEQICSSKFTFSDGSSYPLLNLKGGDTICHTITNPDGGYFNLKIESQICNKCLTETRIDSIFRVISLTGNIEKEFSKQMISIYPNPTYGVLKVGLEKNSKISIYSLNGLLLFEERIDPGIVSIDLSKYHNASYLLSVFDGSNYFRQIIQKQ